MLLPEIDNQIFTLLPLDDATLFIQTHSYLIHCIT